MKITECSTFCSSVPFLDPYLRQLVVCFRGSSSGGHPELVFYGNRQESQLKKVRIERFCFPFSMSFPFWLLLLQPITFGACTAEKLNFQVDR